MAIENKKNLFAYGDSAFEMFEKAPSNIEISYPLCNGVIADIKNMQLLLRNFIMDCNKGVIKPAEFYMAVPSDITDVEKRAFFDLVKDANIKAKKIMRVEKAVADGLGLDIDVKKLCFEENEDINITEYTQAAMVTASVAILKKIEEMGLKPDLTAGLSLGEYCALVASDVMSFEDAVKVVRQRGILMQDTVPAGEGAMSAVLGMKKEAIEAVLPDVEGIVTIANYNCPGQIVISGESKAVAEAGEALKEAGAKRVLPLKVSGPFHSPMLKPAGEKLLDVLADVEVDDPTVPYVSNTTAELITSNDQVKELLGRQVYSSVCWEQSIEKMIADGADTFVEIGPGRTLCGFMRKIDRNVKAINIAKVEDLEKLKEIM